MTLTQTSNTPVPVNLHAPNTTATDTKKIPEDIWRAYMANAGEDVYASAARRVHEGVGLTYPAREVLGLLD